MLKNHFNPYTMKIIEANKKVYFKSKRDYKEMHGKLIPLKSSKKYLDGLWAEELPVKEAKI